MWTLCWWVVVLHDGVHTWSHQLHRIIDEQFTAMWGGVKQGEQMEDLFGVSLHDTCRTESMRWDVLALCGGGCGGGDVLEGGDHEGNTLLELCVEVEMDVDSIGFIAMTMIVI